MADRLEEARQDYEAEQKQLILQAIEVVNTYLPLMLSCSRIVATVDCLSAFAYLATTHDWVAPRFSSDKTMAIKDMRHVLLEELTGPFQVVPNDVVLSNEQYAELISGVNMGGKSTYMRAIGLTVLLAQIGCFVPAKDAVLPIFHSIFVRSGSADSSLAQMSTFMVEMSDMSHILKEATSQSLVLIDELGRGTSVSDGFGLAFALLENLAYENKAAVFCATHLHDLNRLADRDAEPSSVFRACHVEAKVLPERPEDVTRLFKVKDGRNDESLGISIAKLADFPDAILLEAWQLYAEWIDDGSDEKVGNKRKLVSKQLN
ncbi:MutS family DNA mismatch repair protein [archaeon]|nr:MAG: MutS family DNA mismatch repair protein [archaeon]